MASLSNKVSKYPEEQWIPAQPASQKKRASALDERKVMPAADVRQLRRPAAAKKGAGVKAEAHEVDPANAERLAQVDAVHKAWVINFSPNLEYENKVLCNKICYGPPGLRSAEFISTLSRIMWRILFPAKQADELIKLDEFAAGNAFWSYKLSQTGQFKIRALDTSSPHNNEFHGQFAKPFYPVTSKPDVVPDVGQGAAESVLFASWLPPGPAGNRCLQAYEQGKGKLFICEGEEEGFSCADDAFFERLNTNWVRLGVPFWAQTLRVTSQNCLQAYVPENIEIHPYEVPQDVLEQKSYSCMLTLHLFSSLLRKFAYEDSKMHLCYADIRIHSYLELLNSTEDIAKMDDFLKGLIPHMQVPKLAKTILAYMNHYIHLYHEETLSIILSAGDQDSLETLKQIESRLAERSHASDQVEQLKKPSVFEMAEEKRVSICSTCTVS